MSTPDVTYAAAFRGKPVVVNMFASWCDQWERGQCQVDQLATVPAASRIALVVGTWLSLMNQGGPIFDGHPPWIKLALNYLTPFTVASLGFLAARRRRNVERLVALLRDGNG